MKFTIVIDRAGAAYLVIGGPQGPMTSETKAYTVEASDEVEALKLARAERQLSHDRRLAVPDVQLRGHHDSLDFLYHPKED